MTGEEKMKNEYKILIIEDDMLLNDMTKRLLTQHGYCATSAYSGSEALLLIERSSFDLILLDLMLSVRRNMRMKYFAASRRLVSNTHWQNVAR